MPALSWSIHHLMLRRAHKNQKRVALQLLALSGVVRPGHVELRYTALIGSTAFHAQRMTCPEPLIQSLPFLSWAHTISFHLQPTWQWMISLGMTLVRAGKRRDTTDEPARSN
ncbi:MAG: hypothetical protein ABI980_11370 [Nitrospirota bacterium]